MPDVGVMMRKNGNGQWEASNREMRVGMDENFSVEDSLFEEVKLIDHIDLLKYEVQYTTRRIGRNRLSKSFIGPAKSGKQRAIFVPL